MIKNHRYFEMNFAIALVVGCVVNLLYAFFQSDGPNVMDGMDRGGWPFVVWERGGYGGWATYNSYAYLLDVLVWSLAAVAFAVIRVRSLSKKGKRVDGLDDAVIEPAGRSILHRLKTAKQTRSAIIFAPALLMLPQIVWFYTSFFVDMYPLDMFFLRMSSGGVLSVLLGVVGYICWSKYRYRVLSVTALLIWFLFIASFPVGVVYMQFFYEPM